MLLDLIGAVVLTAASATMIGALASVLPWSSGARIVAALALSLWFALVAALAASGALAAARGVGPLGVAAAVSLPLALLAVAMRDPRLLAPAVEAIPLEVLVALNAVRILGVFFIVLHAYGRLPAPFAPSAGWGDILVGLTALPVAHRIVTRARGWRGLALAWNTFGLLDLAVAVSLGVASSPGTPLRIFFGEPDASIMSGLPWLLVPAFLVPLFALTHLAVFARLRIAGDLMRPARA
jgi:hypothetical protein